MATHQQILEALRTKLNGMVTPRHSDFFDKAAARGVDDATYESMYEEADRKYSEVCSKYAEECQALSFAITHHENQIKLDLAHSLIADII